jgi:hypothetical protein
MDECDALLDACGRLAARKLEPDIGRAVDGSRVLFEYERAMLSRGYQRYGGVFMDRASVDAHRRAAVEVQKAAHARVRDAASAQSNRGIATERVAKEFGDRKAADSYAKMQNKYFNSENRFYVKTRGKNWVVCVMDKGDRGATGQSAAMNRPGFKNFGYVDPYQGIPRFSKTVVASYPTYDAAYEAKKRRGASLSGPSDAMDEAVIYAGNAVAFTPPAPKYDIEYNAESKLWDLFMVRQ